MLSRCCSCCLLHRRSFGGTGVIRGKRSSRRRKKIGDIGKNRPVADSQRKHVSLNVGEIAIESGDNVGQVFRYFLVFKNCLYLSLPDGMPMHLKVNKVLDTHINQLRGQVEELRQFVLEGLVQSDELLSLFLRLLVNLFTAVFHGEELGVFDDALFSLHHKLLWSLVQFDEGDDGFDAMPGNGRILRNVRKMQREYDKRDDLRDLHEQLNASPEWSRLAFATCSRALANGSGRL